MIYSVVLVSTLQQCESIIHTHGLSLFLDYFPHRSLQWLSNWVYTLQWIGVEFPVLYSRSLLVIYFIFPVKLRKAKNKFSKKENIKDIKENKNKQGKREIWNSEELKLAEVHEKEMKTTNKTKQPKTLKCRRRYPLGHLMKVKA